MSCLTCCLIHSFIIEVSKFTPPAKKVETSVMKELIKQQVKQDKQMALLHEQLATILSKLDGPAMHRDVWVYKCTPINACDTCQHTYRCLFDLNCAKPETRL